MASGFRSLKNGLILESAPSLTVDGGGQLQYYSNSLYLHNGTTSSTVVTASHTATLTNKTMSGASNTFSNIGYSSLVLTGGIVNADISASAAIAVSKLANSTALSLLGRSANSSGAYADITASSNNTVLKRSSDALSFSTIVNADIDSAAAIARSKIATGSTNRLVVNDGSTGALTDASAITASRALISDANGIPTHSTVTSTELGYVSGVTSAIQTQLGSKLSLSGGTMSGSIDMNSSFIQNLPTPSSPGDAVNKSYVDALAQGFDTKASVKCATTAPITLSGEQTIDGVLTSSSRVLVKDQASASENGIYVSDAGAWTRATDMDAWTEVPGAYMFVEEGTINGDTGWVCISNTGGTIGVTSITFSQFTSGGTYTTDGQGIEIAGTQITLELDGVTLTKSASGLKVTDNTFATVTLNNLGSTALNASLIPATDNTIDLGSTTKRYTTLFASNVGTASVAGSLYGSLLSISSSGSTYGQVSFAVSSETTPSGANRNGLSVFSNSNTAYRNLSLFTLTVSSNDSGNLNLETGNASAGNSGSINLQTGTATGTRGDINLNAASVIVNHLTASRAVVTNASKGLTSSATTDTEIGYVSGVTSAIQTQLNGKISNTLTSATGDMIYASSANTPARLPIGSSNQVLKVNGGIPTWAAAPTGGVNYMSANPDAEGNVTTGYATYLDSDSVTFTDAGDTVGLTAHNLSTGTAISFTSITSTTGISVNTTYYVIYDTSSTFKVASSLANAQAGTALTLTTNGSGTMVRSIPVNGTAGSATTTFTVTSTDPLRSTYSFLLTKDASNRMGEGVSYDFTIDKADKGKVLQGTFEYAISSGTFADDDVAVWFYDVTNGTLIQPAPYKLKNHSLDSERFPFEFQTSSSSTSYRLIIHIASASTSAYTLKFDNFNVGPQAKLYGSPVTDAVSFTPTGGWTGAATYTGRKWRQGDREFYEVYISLSGAPTGTNLTINLPVTIDTSKVTLTNGNNAVLGRFDAYTGTGSVFHGTVNYSSTTAVNLIYYISSTSELTAANLTATAPGSFASGGFVIARFDVPVLGYSSSVVMSSDADTRVVAANYTGSGTTLSAGSTTKIGFTTKVVDTHNKFVTDTYTIPVGGYYDISAFINANAASWAAADRYILYLYINNGATQYTIDRKDIVSTATQYPSVSGIIQGLLLNAGDTIDFRILGDRAATLIYSHFSIKKVSGPAQIAASETVAARYTSTDSYAISNSWTVFKFNTKTFDTHGSYSTSTGLYTVSTPGKYSVKGTITTAAVNLSTSQAIFIAIYKNGTIASYLDADNGGGVSATFVVSGSDTIQCNAGDTLALYTLCSVVTAAAGTEHQSHLAIERIGN